MTGETYDADYFLRGVETGKSNYSDYRWLGEVTLEYATFLRRHLGLERKDLVLDYGCARGYLVKALRMAGINALGCDISQWAIENCDPEVRGSVSCEASSLEGFNKRVFNWVHSKDVLEHIPPVELTQVLPKLFMMSDEGCLFIVPLAESTGGKFIYPNDELDPTHVNRFTLSDWIKALELAALIAQEETGEKFTIAGGFHMHGLKPASASHPYSTGFLTVKRF